MCFCINFAQEEKKIMTNKEIKFELAKVALATCRHMTSESLSESLTNLYDWVMEEPDQKPVWSKEDENLFRCAIDAVKQESKVRTDGCLDEEIGEMVTNWLKSLKDRVGCEVNCTTTKEWSEEDERKYIQAIEALEDFGKFELADWLKEKKGGE